MAAVKLNPLTRQASNSSNGSFSAVTKKAQTSTTENVVASFLNIDEDEADCDITLSQSNDIQSEIEEFFKVF
jgi:hypothetical protein